MAFESILNDAKREYPCNLFLIVCRRPPHHFTAKRVKENMIKAFLHFDTVICPADSELGGFFARFTSAVNGNEEVMAAAFHVQCDFPIVSDNDRTDVEAVRSYRGNGDRIGMRNDDRAATLNEYAVEPVGVAITSPSA